MAAEAERIENTLSSDEEAKRQRLALKVVELAKALVLADNHFLSAAVGRLGVVPGVLGVQFATNGSDLIIDPGKVIHAFKETNAAPKHDLLHSIVHCLFLHPYVGASVDQHYWDLACDIAAERAVADLIGPRPGARGARTATILGRIERELGCRATAEKVYNRLREGMWERESFEWALMLHSDDHTAWYCFSGSQSGDGNGSSSDDGESSSDSSGGSSNGSEKDSSQSGDANSSGSAQDGSRQDGTNNSSGSGQDDRKGSSESSSDPLEAQRKFGSDAGFGETIAVSSAGGSSFMRMMQPDLEKQQEEWRQVATSLAVNLQTMSAKRGKGLSGFVDDLELASQQKESYRDFLRQFAIMGEAMKISDDEFDNIFYTYGMKLYGNLPLIEPLEFREEKLIREFVIVIDTSGSVQGDVVKKFIDTTFDILKSTESFFGNVHIRIIQCDAEVQSDDKVTNLDELAEWGRTMKVLGCGGTDFRPAFAYVDKLVEDGEFENLGGLVYFTDGWGTYPEYMPQYKTAFVFYDEDYRCEDVPPWAVQVVLDSDSLAGE